MVLKQGRRVILVVTIGMVGRLVTEAPRTQNPEVNSVG